MANPPLDFEALAKACVDGDLDAFAAASVRLGWTLTEPARAGLLRALGQVEAITLAHAIRLLTEAAMDRSGVALTQRKRVRGGGKEVAIAFRDERHIHFAARHATDSSMNPGHLWPELRPWHKSLGRNRRRLQAWAQSAAGIVSVPFGTPRTAGLGGELLAAVLADPDDVARRLVYADYLAAQGDAQGELIQLCERRRALGHGEDGLDARIAELEREHGERIAGEVARLASAYTLERGFVTRIQIMAARFGKHGERLVECHPIERVELEQLRDQELVRCACTAALRRVRVLSLLEPGDISWRTWMTLWCSPHFTALRRLEMSGWGDYGAMQMALTELRAPQLQSMSLANVSHPGPVLAGLAHNKTVRLRDLDASWCMTPYVAVRLNGRGFEQLERLRLRNPTRHKDEREWFDGASLPALTSLELDGYFPLDSIDCPNLRRLSLVGGGRLEAKSLLAFVERLPKLETLHVSEIEALEGEQRERVHELVQRFSRQP
jgi:uncharacterized protein (TIGR02996 family)